MPELVYAACMASSACTSWPARVRAGHDGPKLMSARKRFLGKCDGAVSTPRSEIKQYTKIAQQHDGREDRYLRERALFRGAFHRAYLFLLLEWQLGDFFCVDG